MYGALVAAPDSIRTGLLNLFRPRTSPPSTATVLRSVAVAAGDHVDHPPQLRAGHQRLHHRRLRAGLPRRRELQRGWDIYNEHFNYVDPHYLYPPGGTLLMAPFGYLPVDASRYWFITFNTVAIDARRLPAGAAVQIHARPRWRCPPCSPRCSVTESVTNTLVFTNINGCILLLEVLFFRWLLRRQGQRTSGGPASRSV